MYTASLENNVAVRTPYGLTQRMCIPKIVQQGGTWGPVLCSNTIDVIGRKVWARGQHSYLYRNSVKILPLAMVDDICTISNCGLESLKWNSFINTHAELKKLRFHIPNEEGKSKCHKLHVGCRSDFCPELQVHGTTMEEVEFDDYLGDIISNDGKNKKNLEKRLARGMGQISQIMNLLDVVSFGQHYIEIALLLRQTLFLSSMMNNIEVWHAIKSTEVEALEKLDRMLLKRILKAPLTTPKESFYLELGIMPVGIILKTRRILYLHYLLNRPRTEMLAQVFWAQWHEPYKGDWVTLVRQDLVDLGLTTNPESLSRYSKQTLGQLVKDKARSYAFKTLLEVKSKHSKMRFLNYSEFKPQNYFFLPGVHISVIRSAFLFRVHMHRFSENYRENTTDSRLCPLCKKHSDSQENMAICDLLKSKLKGDIHHDIENIYTESVLSKSMYRVSEAISLREKEMT